MGLQDCCFGFYVVSSGWTLYRKVVFALLFPILGVFLGLSLWVGHGALELRRSQSVVFWTWQRSCPGCVLSRFWEWVFKRIFKMIFEENVECFGKWFFPKDLEIRFWVCDVLRCYLKWFRNGFSKEFWKKKCIILQRFWKEFFWWFSVCGGPKNQRVVLEGPGDVTTFLVGRARRLG